jgi:RNA polymerase sigma factor (sigma-70 family)
MTKSSPIIHIVDDDASFRQAIGDLLSACGYRVSLSESAKHLLELPPGDEPSCILLDVQMAGVSGPELQDRLADLGYKLPIVFISGHGDIPTTVQTIKAGAEDFLTKPVSKAKLLAVIERALARYEEMREQDARTAALRSLLSRLTSREREVFALLVRGKVHKQIAYALNVSERTVKAHRHNVMHKFQVRSLAELGVIAERLGLLPPIDPRSAAGPAQENAISRTPGSSFVGADGRHDRRLRSGA